MDKRQSQHVAPEESAEHLALRSAARKAGQNEEGLRDLLWLIDAHDRLLGLGRIAENLLQILAAITASPQTAIWQQDALAIFRGWPELLRWIVKIHKDADRMVGTRGDRSPILQHGVERNCCYAFLWDRPADRRYSRCYSMLQWHLLWAHSSYLYRESKRDRRLSRSEYEAYGGEELWTAFPNSPYLATLRVRDLAKVEWSPLLHKLPVELSPVAFASALHKVECPEDVSEPQRSDWAGYRQHLQSFLMKANGLENWSTRERGNDRTSVRHEKRPVLYEEATPGDAEDPDAHWSAAHWVTTPSPTGRLTPTEILELDLDPDEISEPEGQYLVADEAAPEDPQHLAVRSALAARGLCRHVQLAHQLLPWQYNQLTLQELALLLHQGSEVLRVLPSEPREWNETQHRLAELVALIHVILWTGSTLDRAWHLKLLPGAKATDDLSGNPIGASELFFDLERHQWRIPALSPLYKSEIPDPDHQAHPVVESFLLPDIAYTKEFLTRLLRRREANRPPGKANYLESADEPAIAANDRADAGYVFVRTVAEYGDELQKWLRNPANNFSGRVTTGRLGSFLFNRIASATGDIMAAVLITGHNRPQARTQQFYATYSVQRLREIYREATVPIVSQAYHAAKLTEPGREFGPEAFVEGYVGARLYAKTTSVKRMVCRLKKQIKEAESNSEAILFHNRYTLYTVLMFAYATSMRAIWTPYQWPELVDESTRFILISDKDDVSEHKTRPAWVPEVVLEQMQAYAKHVLALAKKSPILRDWPEPCFFLKADGKPFHVRPKTLGVEMRPYLALPPNAHRKYMRNELMARGCPPEVVQAWMGHAFQGEEPGGPNSSFSFDDYRTALKSHLLPLLKALGWELLITPLVIKQPQNDHVFLCGQGRPTSTRHCSF